MELQDLISKAWEDEDFKRFLLEHPKETIEKELGIKLPPEVEIFIHEQTATQIHLILPVKPKAE
ncbi:MAG: NHLP leader peptide family RiPP precursor [Chloroflexota bacterium]